MLLRKIVIMLAIAGSASVATAQNIDVITARQAIYKGFGGATKPIGPMLKGTTPFDLAVVRKALTTYAEGARKLPALFPDDSKTGHDTEALPAIWTHKDDFLGRLTKLGNDSDAALTSITDKASFTATMPKILGECGACHKEYRAHR